MVWKVGRKILKFIGWFSGTILGALGVITSGCGRDPAAYGLPPSVYISGDVKSGDQGIQGIQVRMLSADGSQVFDSFLSDQYGNYWLEEEVDVFSLPDSVRVEAADIDGAQNGSYLPADTLVHVEFQGTSAPDIFIHVDFDLVPEEE
jgi:putative lipoprotein (rSAM/lipoprotein system)